MPKDIKVCVYGTLKRGYKAHATYLSKALYVCEIIVPAMMLAFPSYPGAILHKDINIAHPAHKYISEKTIYGELFMVPSDVIPELDYMEGVPNWFRRVELEDPIMGKYEIYCLDPRKYIQGHQIVVPGGTWLGENTTVSEMDFNNGLEKPKCIGWWNKDRFEKTMQMALSRKYKHNTPIIVEDYDDDEGVAEAEITLPPMEDVHDLHLKVNEA